jgi:hypothetical protein
MPRIPNPKWKKNWIIPSASRLLQPRLVNTIDGLLPRSTRRNLARDEHALNAWKSGKHHIKARRTGVIVVPFS